ACLRGKLRGIFDSVRPYFIAYAIPAVAVSQTGGWLALLVTLTSLLVVWPFMYHAGCWGLRASVLGRGTWRSLLAALSAVYGPSALICVICQQALLTVIFLVIESGFGVRLHLQDEVMVLVVGYCLCAAVASVALAAFARSQLRRVEGKALP